MNYQDNYINEVSLYTQVTLKYKLSFYLNLKLLN